MFWHLPIFIWVSFGICIKIYLCLNFFLPNITHVTICFLRRGFKILQVILRMNDAVFSSSYCLYLNILQVGIIKVIAKLGLKILRNHCQNFALIMTNGIRKIRQGVDIFDKRILDSCKFIMDSASEYGLVYWNLCIKAGRV